MSSHPLHNLSCRSWVYPWHCPECSKAVHVYECTCGSWVMFDALGGPWPKHSCFDLRYKELAAKVMPILKAGADPKTGTFKPFADLRELLGPLSERRPNIGEEKTTPSSHQLPPGDLLIIRMDPMPDEHLSFIGIVREKITKAAKLSDIYRVLGDLGRKAFGLPPEKDAVQLTIVENSGEPHESYSCIADKGMLTSSIVPGVMVWVRMSAKVSPSARAWIVTDIEAL